MVQIYKWLLEHSNLQTLPEESADFTGALGFLMVMDYEEHLYASVKWFVLEPLTSEMCYIFVF